MIGQGRAREIAKIIRWKVEKHKCSIGVEKLMGESRGESTKIPPHLGKSSFKNIYFMKKFHKTVTPPPSGVL